jgi:SAM-dependent methyltransferase
VFEVSSVYGIDYFEHGVGSNYKDYADDPGWPVTTEVLARHFPSPARMLELGAAKGYFVRAARDAGFECVGADISEYAAGKSGGLVEHTDATTGLDFPAASFDLVVSWEFLEHIDGSQITKVTAEMDRVLRPGGVQIHRIGILIPGREPEFFSDCTHVLPLTREEWPQYWPAYERLSGVEDDLDTAFADRDWRGRFFAFKKPE